MMKRFSKENPKKDHVFVSKKCFESKASLGGALSTRYSPKMILYTRARIFFLAIHSSDFHGRNLVNVDNR